ncbi:single-stranded-DNA-specific exonuclease RecJ [Candidatus Kinetoplastibacterium sorsogonicusi]
MYNHLLKNGIHPILAKLWSSRGVTDIKQISKKWIDMISPFKMLNIIESANTLADSIINQKKILIIADYDCDGATACAVAIKSLKSMNANVDFLVPNRFETGYGLSNKIVDIAYNHKNGKPDIIITVDNGISSIDGVRSANEKNISVIITDHHLPGKILPDALHIINPNQAQCAFPSKNLAGVGVIFYLMIVLRYILRKRGIYSHKGGPQLEKLLDLVALGTIADVVKLDDNNRLLVSKGLQQIRRGNAQKGLNALIKLLGIDYKNINVDHLGFNIAPRINAAGRLDDISIGIECLITDDDDVANKNAILLDQINTKRRLIEKTMNQEAIEITKNYKNHKDKFSICIYKQEWHQGIIGLIASKLKEKFWKPVFVFAESSTLEIRGSGRSIPGINLRNILEQISLEYRILNSFGGHAMAAGVTLNKYNFKIFSEAFEKIINNIFDSDTFKHIIETDGALDIEYMNTFTSDLINQEVWGNGFPAPLFFDEFAVIKQEILNNSHLKMILKKNNQLLTAIFFGKCCKISNNIKAVYKLTTQTWKQKSYFQLIIIDIIN